MAETPKKLHPCAHQLAKTLSAMYRGLPSPFQLTYKELVDECHFTLKRKAFRDIPEDVMENVIEELPLSVEPEFLTTKFIFIHMEDTVKKILGRPFNEMLELAKDIKNDTNNRPPQIPESIWKMA